MRRERRTSSSSYGQFYAASTERAGDVLTSSAPRDPGFAGTPGRRLLGANGTTIKADAALRAPGPHHRATTTTTPAAANAAVHVRADTVPRVGAFNGLVGRGSAHRERDPRSLRDAAAGGVPSSTRGRVGTHLPGAAGGGLALRRAVGTRPRREARRRRATRNARNARGPFRAAPRDAATRRRTRGVSSSPEGPVGAATPGGFPRRTSAGTRRNPPPEPARSPRGNRLGRRGNPEGIPRG